MNSIEAKKILALYRPGTSDAADPEVIEALAVVCQDPALGAWFEQHCRVQIALRDKLREIPVPVSLKGDILAHPKQGPNIPWWRDADWLPLAACIVLLLGLSLTFSNLWHNSHVPDHFTDFEGRMVRAALREYRMDILTNDLSQVRRVLSSRGAPSEFSVPAPLAKLTVTGGGVLRWRNHPVSMVCFDRGDKQMLFLFIMKKDAVKDAPGHEPALGEISSLATIGWSENDQTYVLAGPPEADFVKKYF